jgi:CHASE3 domain sensor protein
MLTADQPEEHRRVDTLAALVGSQLRLFQEVIATRRARGTAAASALLEQGHERVSMSRIRRHRATRRVGPPISA